MLQDQTFLSVDLVIHAHCTVVADHGKNTKGQNAYFKSSVVDPDLISRIRTSRTGSAQRSKHMSQFKHLLL
jgi:hypothetical protein